MRGKALGDDHEAIHTQRKQAYHTQDKACSGRSLHFCLPILVFRDIT